MRSRRSSPPALPPDPASAADPARSRTRAPSWRRGPARGRSLPADGPARPPRPPRRPRPPPGGRLTPPSPSPRVAGFLPSPGFQASGLPPAPRVREEKEGKIHPWPRSTSIPSAARAEGEAEMKNLLGGKGANLAEMASLGLPVPAGFTITTECCTDYFDERRQVSPTASRTQVADGPDADRRGHGHEVRRPGEPAAGLLPLRRPPVDARHDGDRAQRRPLLDDDSRAWSRSRATSGSSTTPTAA